jgi:hypothetical protein
MTVHIGETTFSDWTSLQFQGGWSDTFIFRVCAQAGLPPFVFKKALQHMTQETRQKRPGASIWVQVQGHGDWYAAEVRRSLRGLHLPFAVSRADAKLDWLAFSSPPGLLYSRSQPPPLVEEKQVPLTLEELRCLQSLARMEKGRADEIASLADLRAGLVEELLAGLEERELIRGEPPAIWQIRKKGVSAALRSWSIPKKLSFPERLEEYRRQIGSDHRHIARLWPAWLRAAWRAAEIWGGWSEVRVPELSVIPDALAWGRIQGYETLFWLEVGDEHKSSGRIAVITARRLSQARELCTRSGARLVYAQLTRNWVHLAAGYAYAGLPRDTAVVLGNWKKFGELPVVEWGRVMVLK